MQDLHLVGFTKDRRNLIFSTRKGAKSGSFLVPVDGDLLDAVDEVASYVADHASGSESPDEPPLESRPQSQPRVESSLSVKEVQTRLRAGEPVEAIASQAGVDADWVERFATPIRAEQRRIVERAMGARLQRPRAGKSAVSLRQAISAAMAERKVRMNVEEFESAWHSHVEAPGQWVVEFTFPTRGKDRTLKWDFEIATGRLTTSDRFASQLGFRAAADLPSKNSNVDDASTTGGRRSGGLAIPGTTKGSPASPADPARRPGPPVTPRRPMPPPTASAMSPRRPSVPPPSPPPTPSATDGRPPPARTRPQAETRPQAGTRPPARPEAEDFRRATTVGSPAGRPERPEPTREPGDRRPEPVDTRLDTRRPPGLAERRPQPVSPAESVGPRPDRRGPASPAPSASTEEVAAPPASMTPRAPASRRLPQPDVDLPTPVRRPAPVASDVERAGDEGEVEIAPSLRVIPTEEDSSVRLIPASPSDDADQRDTEPRAAEPEPPVVRESMIESEEDLLDEVPDDEDADDEDTGDVDVPDDEDDLSEDDVAEDDLAEDDLADDDGDGGADEAELDVTAHVESVDDSDHENELADDELVADDSVEDDVDEDQDVDDQGELVEAEDRDDEPQPVAEIDDDVDTDSAEPSDDDHDHEVEGERLADRRSVGRVRFATEDDRGRAPSGGHDPEPVVDTEPQPGDEGTTGDAQPAETIAWSKDEPEHRRLRPIGVEDLHPRRRSTDRRPRRAQPIIARRDTPADKSERPALDAGSESKPRRSSAQFRAGFAKVAGADEGDGGEQPAQDPPRRSAPPAERIGGAEEAASEAGIEWPEGEEPGSGEARPEQRRRAPSKKSPPSGKKPRRRRQPLRAR